MKLTKQIKKNRNKIPKLRVTIIGAPSSGKTTLLAALYKNADPEIMPRDVADRFERYLEDLNNLSAEAPKPIPATEPQAKLPREIVFDLTFQDKRLELTTFDYAGEKALNFLQEEGLDIQKRLAFSDAVILLADSYELWQAGSWKKWTEGKNIQFLFSWIKKILSDRYRHNLPFAVICTRSDLVPKDELDHFKKEIEADCRAANIEHVKIRDLSIFGEHRATNPVPNKDANTPPIDFLVPRKELTHSPPALLQLVLELYKAHHKGRKPNIVSRTMLTVFSVIIIAVLSGIILQKITQPDPAKIAEEIRTGPDITLPANQKSLDDILRNHGIGMPEGTKKIKEALLDNIKKHIDKKVKILEYSLNQKKWQPSYAWQAVVFGFKRLRESENRFPFYVEQRNELKAHLDEVEIDNASTQELTALADAYSAIGADAPDNLVDRLRNKVEDEFERKLSRLLEKTTENYDELYSQKIPDLIAKVNTEQTAENFKQQIETLKEYCRLVSDADTLGFDLISYKQRDKNKRYKVRIEITYTDQRGRKQTLEHPSNDFTSRINHRTMQVPVTLGYVYTIKIRRDIFFGGNDVVVRWNSDSLSEKVKSQGYDLPGLTFMVFRDCRDYKKGENHGCWPSNYTKIRNKLELKGHNNFDRLLSPPEILLEANK